MSLQLSLDIDPPKLIDHRPFYEIERNRKERLCRSEAVLGEVLAIFEAQPKEWLNPSKGMQAIKDRHQLGVYINACTAILEARGLIESKNIYFGAERPVQSELAGKRKQKKGEALPMEYLGYRIEYRLKVSA